LYDDPPFTYTTKYNIQTIQPIKNNTNTAWWINYDRKIDPVVLILIYKGTVLTYIVW